jgi:hypothetical protein
MTTSALLLPYFLAGLAKVLITRYGGAGLYRRVMPFFLGAILGEAVTIKISGTSEAGVLAEALFDARHVKQVAAQAHNHR